MIKYLAGAFIAMCAVFLWGYLSGRRLKIREYTVTSPKATGDLNGLRIVQLSDLHCARVGREQGALLSLVRRLSPDIIVLTGDLFDRHRPQAQENAFDLAFELVKLAPTFYVEGNHEKVASATRRREKELIDMGVRVMHNESYDLTVGGASLRIIGINEDATPQQWIALVNSTRFHIVLSHRPEKFADCVAARVDLVFAGHAHGGHVRLLGIGIFASGQGIFPKYTRGIYEQRRTRMIVSTGLGNTKFAVRLFNPKEIVVATLSGK